MISLRLLNRNDGLNCVARHSHFMLPGANSLQMCGVPLAWHACGRNLLITDIKVLTAPSYRDTRSLA